MKIGTISLAALAVLALLVLASGLFIIDETEQVIVTQYPLDRRIDGYIYGEFFRFHCKPEAIDYTVDQIG